MLVLERVLLQWCDCFSVPTSLRNDQHRANDIHRHSAAVDAYICPPILLIKCSLLDARKETNSALADIDVDPTEAEEDGGRSDEGGEEPLAEDSPIDSRSAP